MAPTWRATLKRRHGGAHAVTWADRKCRLCAVPTGPYYDGQPGTAAGESRNATEDLMHFMLECPAYSGHIRAQNPSTVGGPELSVQTDSLVKRIMPDIFDCRQQHDLAACMYSMNQHRTVSFAAARATGAWSYLMHRLNRYTSRTHGSFGLGIRSKGVRFPFGRTNSELIVAWTQAKRSRMSGATTRYCPQLLPWPHAGACGAAGPILLCQCNHVV
jgi:hypothetical protein